MSNSKKNRLGDAAPTNGSVRYTNLVITGMRFKIWGRSLLVLKISKDEANLDWSTY